MMSNPTKCTELILALDLKTQEDSLQLLKQLQDKLTWVKVGLELFTKYGPNIVQSIADMGFKIFLDLKLHDIPNQVASSIRSLKDLPIGMLTLHTSGGKEMMEWSCRARDEVGSNVQLLGVTVLTSMDEAGLRSLGINCAPSEQVMRLAHLGVEAGMTGFVCSAKELPMMSQELGPDTVLVTPGIRPAGSDANEQRRVMTPEDAAAAGASYIVVGRPIYQAEDPASVTQNILNSIKNG